MNTGLDQADARPAAYQPGDNPGWGLTSWRAALVAGLALTAMGIVMVGLRPAIAVITGAVAVITSLGFIRRNQSVATQPLLLITVSGGVGILAAAIAGVQETYLDGSQPSPGLSELLFAASYVGLAAGLESLRRARTKHADAEGLIDGMVVSIALSLVVWVTLLGPALRNSEQAPLEIATNVVFAALSAVIIAVLVRLAIGPGSRAPAWYLLAVAVCAFVAADLAVTISPLIPAALSPIVYTFVTAAMRHPSMPLLVERDAQPPTTVGVRRFVLLTLAMMVAPITLMVMSITNSVTDLIVAAAGAALISALVLVRLSLMLRAGAEQARVEHVLRQVSDRLLVATDARELDAAAVDAVRRLVSDVPGATVGVDRSGVDAPAPTSGHAVTLPLDRSNDAGALIRITSEHPLPAVVDRAIDALNTNLALALESAELSEALQRSRIERRFRTLVENSSDLILVVDANYKITFVSPACARLIGRDETSLLGANVRSLPIDDDQSLLDSLLRRGDQTVFSLPVEMRLRHPDGHRWFEVAARDLHDQPDVAGFVLNCRDVADRKDTEVRLFRSEARFRALVQNVSDVVAVIDEWGRFSYVSPAITRLLGYRAEQLIDTPATAIISTDQRRHAHDAMQAALIDPSDPAGSLELRVLALDGGVRTLDVTVSDLRHDPAVQGIVLNARDVTVRKELERTLRHQAHHDALTGLVNRTRFGELVEACAHEGDTSACVLFVDLDDFKTVNDSLGHAVGDDLLLAVAQRLTNSLPNNAVAARLGGDEFAILVRTAGDDLGPVGVALRLLHELRVPFDVDGWEIVVTASIGISAIGEEGATAEVVLRNADMAMYLAKERGKDRVELFEEAMHVTAFERLELKADLARAITAGQLTLHYQPVINLETGRITGAEALVRWQHPRRGLLGPDSFIGIAEETGLIVQLGQWVLEEACQQLRDWQLNLPDDATLSMSVNLSVRQLEQASIVDSVREVIDQFGLHPRTLTLEITETVVIDHMEDDRSRLIELKDLGVQIALDDFGIGYSSLRYADDLPVDILKVDRSFVAGITGSEATPVLEAIVALGSRLGVHTVAEGIETPTQITALREIGCDLGQGFWFSPPVPPDAFLDLLNRNLTSGGFDTSGNGSTTRRPPTS